MANNVIPISQARMPAAMKARMASGVAINKNYAEGVADAFPRLSIKGKIFSIRIDGATDVLRDPDTKIALNALDLVLVNGSKTLSKSYYASDFQDDGDFTPPDCWSLDSIRPDASVANKVSGTCQGCPMNAFGSAPSRDGTARAGKACQDARRIAVIFPGQLEQENPLIFMLRVPQTSLKELKKYAQLLERQDWDTAGCVTRLTFDEVAYPKLRFNFVDGLDDKEYAAVTALAESKFVESMLGAPDFDNAAVQKAAEQAGPPPGRDPPTRQATPLVGDKEVTGEQVAAKPKQEKKAETRADPTQSTLKAVEPTLIELPDGRWFDPINKVYVERPEPKVDMPEMDPETITLPDGRFFSKTTNSFVTGPEIGAKAFVAETVPKRKGTPRAKKEAPAEQQAALPLAEAQPGEEQAEEQGGDTAAANGATDVGPSSAAMDDMLASILPKKTTRK